MLDIREQNISCLSYIYSVNVLRAHVQKRAIKRGNETAYEGGSWKTLLFMSKQSSHACATFTRMTYGAQVDVDKPREKCVRKSSVRRGCTRRQEVICHIPTWHSERAANVTQSWAYKRRHGKHSTERGKLCDTQKTQSLVSGERSKGKSGVDMITGSAWIAKHAHVCKYQSAWQTGSKDKQCWLTYYKPGCTRVGTRNGHTFGRLGWLINTQDKQNKMN